MGERAPRPVPLVVGAVLALGAATAAPAEGQLARVGAASLGVGDNVTATARGFAAVAANPAGMALPGTDGFSLTVLPGRVGQGLDPVGLGDLAEWEGEPIPHSVKERWLVAVEGDGGQSGAAAGELSAFALQVGPVGLQLSTLASSRAELSPDAVELLLFGNAGRSGEPRDFELRGSEVEAWVVSTAALAFAVPVREVAGGRLAVGATLGYSVGHGLLVGRDAGSSVTNDPVEVELQLPVLVSDTEDPAFDQGSGVGLDLGVAWARDRLRLGATLRNVVHTFEWDLSEMEYRPGSALFDESTSDSDFEPRPAEEAPGVLREEAAALGFEPVLSLGAAWEARPDVTVSADLRNRFGDGMAVEPGFHLGAGVEARPVRRLPVRAHVARITDGFQLGGGLSLVLGPVSFNGALAARFGALDDATLGMFSLSFGDGPR